MTIAIGMRTVVQVIQQLEAGHVLHGNSKGNRGNGDGEKPKKTSNSENIHENKWNIFKRPKNCESSPNFDNLWTKSIASMK